MLNKCIPALPEGDVPIILLLCINLCCFYAGLQDINPLLQDGNVFPFILQAPQ
jgi:hypothetical protein